MKTDHIYHRATWRSLCLILALTVISAGPVAAQTFTNLHNFTFSSSDGGNPLAGVILSGTNLYGTASTGGTANLGFVVGRGAVFVVSTNGMGVAGLQDFSPVRTGFVNNGAAPAAGLILSGNTLYGTTSEGGSASNGVVFAVNTNGSGFTNFYNFTATNSAGTNIDGANPVAGLILSGTNLYGTTTNGGGSGNGTVFAVDTNGVVFTTLHGFTATNISGTNGDGANPEAGLILSGTNLYGTAKDGGSSGEGTVFRVSTHGAGFTNLHSFTGGSDGGSPVAGLVLSGNTLYGTTSSGGSGGNGTVFQLNTNGTSFVTLHSFIATNNTGTNTDGAVPYAALTLSGNILYGTTSAGGSAGNGTVFQVNTNGTGFTTLHSFTAMFPNIKGNYTNSDGAMPCASLILSGDILYGTAFAGGISSYGTLFSILAPPQLAITPSGTNVVLTWTNPAPGLVLQSTTNLQAPIWNTNLPAPVVINGQNTVTNATSGTQQFYRLGE